MLPTLPPPTDGETLLLAWTRGSRLAVSHRLVERVLPAALPSAVPGLTSGYALHVGDDLVPLLFASQLLGATSVTPRASDWVVLLRHHQRRLALWVEAVDDLEPYRKVPGGVPTHFVCAFHDAAPAVPVLDAGALFEAGV